MLEHLDPGLPYDLLPLGAAERTHGTTCAGLRTFEQRHAEKHDLGVPACTALLSQQTGTSTALEHFNCPPVALAVATRRHSGTLTSNPQQQRKQQQKQQQHNEFWDRSLMYLLDSGVDAEATLESCISLPDSADEVVSAIDACLASTQQQLHCTTIPQAPSPVCLSSVCSNTSDFLQQQQQVQHQQSVLQATTPAAAAAAAGTLEAAATRCVSSTAIASMSPWVPQDILSRSTTGKLVPQPIHGKQQQQQQQQMRPGSSSSRSCTTPDALLSTKLLKTLSSRPPPTPHARPVAGCDMLLTGTTDAAARTSWIEPWSIEGLPWDVQQQQQRQHSEDQYCSLSAPVSAAAAVATAATPSISYQQLQTGCKRRASAMLPSTMQYGGFNLSKTSLQQHQQQVWQQRPPAKRHAVDIIRDNTQSEAPTSPIAGTAAVAATAAFLREAYSPPGSAPYFNPATAGNSSNGGSSTAGSSSGDGTGSSSNGLAARSRQLQQCRRQKPQPSVLSMAMQLMHCAELFR